MAALEHDEAVKAAQAIELVETDDGYTLTGLPDESVTHQHAVQEIPQEDVTQEMLTQTAETAESWLLYGGGYAQQRHTTADVITPDNVSDLAVEYLVQTGVGTSMEGSPLVVPTDPPVMYQTNGPNHAKAINARTGEVLWSYTYQNPSGLLLCCDSNNRGFGVLGDKVYMTTLDSGVVALDRYTGEEVWYTSTGDHEVGYSATWAPIPYDGKILTGSAGGEYGVRGFVAALDPEDGEEVWRTHTTPEDQWVGESWQQGCATTWMSPTVDEERDALYAPMGNPGPDFDGTVRPGPNRYSVGTLALDTDSGEVQWNYQESPHDIWDYDSSSPKVLIRDVETDDGSQDVVVSPGKTGWVYTMNADDGQLLRRSEETVQHINMWDQIPHMDEEERVAFVPGAQGGNDWQPPSYSPETGLVYLKQQNAPQEIMWENAEYEAGTTYWGGGLNDWPNITEPEGWNGHTSAVVAVDPASGDRVWREWLDTDPEDPVYLWGGSMTTASGLLFLGTHDGKFVAYDAENGDRLWEIELGAPIASSPMSWYDPGTGKQYVATQVGGSGWLHRGRRGSTVAVFAMEE